MLVYKAVDHMLGLLNACSYTVGRVFPVVERNGCRCTRSLEFELEMVSPRTTLCNARCRTCWQLCSKCNLKRWGILGLAVHVVSGSQCGQRR